ncbi:LamG-like jellyroll fold domain-containing protein [Pelagicoccus mobilis]|uniref:Discoidin domain-containing protein n=1 Tax=Pelagicoccus mobilis TaxID=415221 RepID=A0A934RXU9_9BACT|nr:LamG-like jellyroll fold domain-containing protein [Pelagicoccus mobilis]MBK1877229.1 discoidin domain-containing protein [Pelagicoccus mobilis]
MNSDIIVNLKGPYYNFSQPFVLEEADSGTNGHNVIWQAAPGPDPVVIRGQVRFKGGWSSVGGNIHRLDVSSAGLEYIRNVWLSDGSRLPIAKAPGLLVGTQRWDDPNTSYTDFDGFYINSSDLQSSYLNVTDIELNYRIEWNNHRRKVLDIVDAGGGQHIVKFKQPYASWGGTGFGKVDYDEHFELLHAYEELDQDGEWYYKRDTQELFVYWAGGYGVLNDAEFMLPRTDSLLEIKGTDLNERVTNIVIRGLQFRYTKWDYPSIEGFTSAQAGSYITDQGTVNRIPGAIILEDAEYIRFENNMVTNVGGSGINLVNNTAKIEIIGNDFVDVSAEAIVVGDRLHDQINVREGEATPKDIKIINNDISWAGAEFTCAPGITAYYGERMHILQNTLKNLPYTGVSIGWGWRNNNQFLTNDNLVSFNHITDYNETQRDGAGIYTLGQQPNSFVDGNYIKPSDNASDGGYAGIYFDEGTRHYKARGNVVEVPSDVHRGWVNLHSVPIPFDLGLPPFHIEAKDDIEVTDNYSSALTIGNEEDYEGALGLGDGIVSNTVQDVYVQNTTYVPSAIWTGEADEIIQAAGDRKYLLAHWRFDEGTGSDALDVALGDATDNDATYNLASPVVWEKGIFGQSAELSGSGTFNVAHDAELNPTKAITVSAWVRLDQTIQNHASNFPVLANKQDWGNKLGYNLGFIKSDGSLLFRILGGGSNHDIRITNHGLQVNTWHLITGTFDGEKMKLYVDDQEKAELAYTGTIGTSTQDLKIASGVEGRIDDVRIYNRALSDIQVASMYNYGTPEADVFPDPLNPNRDALTQMKGKDFNETNEVLAGNVLYSIHGGDWVKLADVQFGSGVNGVTARLRTDSNLATVELRLGSPTGALIAEIRPFATAGNFFDFDAPIISPVTGTNDLFIVFPEVNGEVVSFFDWVQFSASSLAHSKPTPSGSTNLALGGTATATSERDSTKVASKAIDDNIDTFWWADPVPYEYWQIDLGQEYQVAKFEMVARQNFDDAKARRGWTILGSNDPGFPTDPANFVTLGRINSGFPHQGTWEGTVQNSGTYRYIRVQKNKDTKTNFAEFRVFEAIVPKSVGMNVAAWKTATSSGDWNNSLTFAASKAVDGDDATIWHSAGGAGDHWWYVDLEFAKEISKVEMVARQGYDQEWARSNFEIVGMNTPDINAGVVIARKTEAPFAAEGTWEGWVSDTTAYRYVGVRKVGGGLMNFAELRVYDVGN